MFRASLFALSLSVLGANASATTLIGSGAHTCGDYLSAVRSNPDREAAMTQWALGFISGTLLTLEKGKSFDVTVVKPAPMKSFLMDYCSQHASDDFYAAVDKYVLSLPLTTSQIPPTLPDFDAINRQTDQDIAGRKGAEAKDFCSRKVGVATGAKDGSQVARQYGAEKAIAWTDCVVDRMYPAPKR